jgi:beta-lactamase regulating signal transducer with metallopeptidase domain
MIIDQAIAAWWEWILPLSAQLAVLAVVVAAIDLLFVRRPAPRFESLLWGLVFVKLLVPPSLTSPVSVAQLASASTLWTPPEAISIAPVRAAGAVWLLGIGLLGWAVLRRSRRLARTLAAWDASVPPLVTSELRSVSQRLRLRRAPRVRMVDAAGDAAVVGLLRPTILVPRELIGDRTRLAHVLLHECAHLKRGDLWWSHLSLLLAILLWFHPAVWIARARLASLRELACDAHVARLLGSDADGYRQTLLSVARLMLAGPTPLAQGQLGFLALAFGATPRSVLVGRWWRWCAGWWGSSLLVVRLVQLRDWEAPTARSRVLSGLLSFIVTAVLAVSCVPLAQPPRPLWQQWAEAPGCLQKRFLLLQALPPESVPSNVVHTP